MAGLGCCRGSGCCSLRGRQRRLDPSRRKGHGSHGYSGGDRGDVDRAAAGPAATNAATGRRTAATAAPGSDPEEKPEFVEEKPTPPPKRPPSDKPVAPIAKPKPVGPIGPMSMSSAKAVAVSAPRPEYPYEARRSKITGSGVCVMTVDPGSGAVTSADMAQSTGNPILDNAATSAFRRWRFKPGTVSRVRTPITFTMSGAQY